MQLNPGTILQLPYYLQVQSAAENNRTNCLALNHRENGQIVVTNTLLQNHTFHLQHTSEIKATKTELAEVFSNIPVGKLLQVCFVKKDGAERILSGYRVSNEDNPLGYSMVFDLEIESGHPLRQVDHRSIKWFIEAGQNPVKMVLK